MKYYQKGFDFDFKDYKPVNVVEYEGSSNSLAITCLFRSMLPTNDKKIGCQWLRAGI